MYIGSVVFFGYKLAMILIDTPIGMVLGLVAYFLSLYLWFFVMADILDNYFLVTSIEMMKNKECIHIVLKA